MFAKRLLQKVKNPSTRNHLQHGSLTSEDLNLRIACHYGIPSTASILAFDPIQRLLAVGTLDGRIKVIGSDNIEGLLIAPKRLPYKHLQFLHNYGFLVSVSTENDIQVWDLENRRMASCLQWQSNITAFAVIAGTCFMYTGDEYGLVSVLKFDVEDGKILLLPHHVPSSSIAEAVGVSLPYNQPVVGVLPQPCTSGNRVLIAYGSGLIILWDVSEARVVVARGNKVLLQEGCSGSPSGANNELPEHTPDHEEEEKEISSICWASSDGSVIAVGYVDGDIMLWDLLRDSAIDGQQAGSSLSTAAKLQLSSSKRRIPVIVLHWAADTKSQNNCKGQLFIYGGDEIGSEEVLTVLSLEWSSGAEILRCVGRVDLSLGGSFADMILMPKAGTMENNSSAALFVLTNPGQLHVYSDANLSALVSQTDKSSSVPTVQFTMVIPLVNPEMTITKLTLISMAGNSSKALLETASITKMGATPTTTAGSKWPLTGGVPSQLSFAEDKRVERIFIAGYQDGSIRIWDATYPVLHPILILEGKVHETRVAGASASVIALDFCSSSTSLAIGNQCGLVFVYKFGDSSKEATLCVVTETKHEVHAMRQEKGFQCIAIFSVLNSPIQTLQYENSGAKLSVGYECGRVAMLDSSSLSVLFITDSIYSSSSPVISISVKSFSSIASQINSPKHSSPQKPKDPPEEVMYILTKDSHICVLDSVTGNMVVPRPMHPKKELTAISMYILEYNTSFAEVSNEKEPELSQDSVSVTQAESLQADSNTGVKSQDVELQTSSETVNSGETLSESLVLLCSVTSLRLYSLKSVMRGQKKAIRKVKLANPCCWTTTFKKVDEKPCGLILLYQTGVLEIRSLPDLEVVSESSLMSILRWTFKANMNRTMSSSHNGQITLANGCELAFVSFLTCENDFRIPVSLPSLHDEVLAAAADAAINVSSNQKKKKSGAPGILSGIVKGFKGKKVGYPAGPSESLPKSKFAHLENVFSRDPFSDPPADVQDDQEALELDIDDIVIDEPVPVVTTSSHEGKNDEKAKRTEREKLFEGASADVKPRLRTHEEILAQYRKAGDVSAVAGEARDRLVQRQEKLERISRRTAELQNGAESFADMANELVKVMESRRKWWHI